jgi:hypothetical protein
VNGAGCAIEYAARAKHRAGRKAEGDSDNETVRPENALYRVVAAGLTPALNMHSGKKENPPLVTTPAQ